MCRTEKLAMSIADWQLPIADLKKRLGFDGLLFGNRQSPIGNQRSPVVD
jgi:hypothetical protein